MNIREIVTAFVLFLATAVPASAETMNVFVTNYLDETVTLSVDGQIVCEMAAQGSCMVPVADGSHMLRAGLGNGDYVDAPIDNPGSSLHWVVDEFGLDEL